MEEEKKKKGIGIEEIVDRIRLLEQGDLALAEGTSSRGSVQ